MEKRESKEREAKQNIRKSFVDAGLSSLIFSTIMLIMAGVIIRLVAVGTLGLVWGIALVIVFVWLSAATALSFVLDNIHLAPLPAKFKTWLYFVKEKSQKEEDEHGNSKFY